MLKSLFLGEFAALRLNYGRILGGGSKVPHRWFIDRTRGTNEPKTFFFKLNFQPLPEIISY